jgi:error-prone DNA polymerase
VRVAGLVVARQRPHTAKGTVFILMEDEAGPINAIVSPDVYERCRAAIRLEPFLRIDGTLQKDGRTYNVIARSVEALELEPGVDPCPLDVSPSAVPDGAFGYLDALRRDSPPALSWGRGGGCR